MTSEPKPALVAENIARKMAERAGWVVLSREDARWLCDFIHGEPDIEHDYNRAHALLERDSGEEGDHRGVV